MLLHKVTSFLEFVPLLRCHFINRLEYYKKALVFESIHRIKQIN